MGSDARDVLGLPSAGPPKMAAPKMQKPKVRGPSKQKPFPNELNEVLILGSWNEQRGPRSQIRRRTADINRCAQIQREAKAPVQASSLGGDALWKLGPE